MTREALVQRSPFIGHYHQDKIEEQNVTEDAVIEFVCLLDLSITEILEKSDDAIPTQIKQVSLKMAPFLPVRWA